MLGKNEYNLKGVDFYLEQQTYTGMQIGVINLLKYLCEKKNE